MPALSTRWKLIAGGAAIIGVVTGGVTAATTDGFPLNDRRDAIELTAAEDVGEQDTTTTTVDPSPESADSPNESVEDSWDSPFDSPDDPDY
ncbi:MAG: hypothetical protein GXY13_09150, partial [Acidimicrobiales bacterium]|nr:hypothetical protein [Acidimicrobiales bacterium]